LTLLAGCASANGQGSEDVATRFYEAFRSKDGAAACALLAPATRTAVVRAAQMPCAKGLLAEHLPSPGPVRSTSVYGDQAQVRLVGDTVFVAVFPTGWRVIAAGCKPRPDRPYECAVEAG
jgi:hypothetical protein